MIHEYAKRLTLLLWTVAALAGAVRSASADPPAGEEFRLFVQPLLSQRCLGCHSQAEASEEDRFRADRLVVDDAGTVDRRFVIAGDAEASEVWRRVTSTDPDVRMPPEGKGSPLAPEELARLKRWIEEGADAESFWADVSPAKALRNGMSAVSSHSKEAVDPVIDPLLEQAWNAAGIEQASPASRETWLRRVTFALTGLPPTIEELDRFLADRSPGARERAVDRLLASPRFGERMAALWLDAARYADTHGYHADAHRDQWRWRDWAIDAFNRNLPYDRFVLDQLAGDLATSDPGDPAPLSHPSDRRLATGFLRNHMINFEDGAFAEEYRVEYVADRVHTVAQAFLGTTLSCARCHDHPNDPISTEDYYSFFAFFDSIDEKGLDGERGNAVPIAPAPTRLQREELAAIEERLAQIESTLVEREPDFRVGQLAWERTALKKEGFVATPGDAALRLTFDEATLEELTRSSRDSAKIEIAGSPLLLPTKSGGELLLDGSSHVICTFPNAIPFAGDLTVAGTFQLTSDDEATLWELSEEEQEDSRPMTRRRLVVAPGEEELRLIAFEGETPVGQRTWKAPFERNVPTRVALRFEFDEADAHVDAFVGGKSLELAENVGVATSADEDAANENAKVSPLDLDRVRGSAFSVLRFGGAKGVRGVSGIVDDGLLFSRALSNEEIDALAGGNAIVDALSTDEAKRTDAQGKALADWYRRNVDPIAGDLLRRRDEIATELATLQAAIPDAMVAADLPQPRTTHVLLRGRYDSPGEVVQPRSLDFGSHSGDVSRPDRLGLAENLVSPDHPRTSRVAVDRLWRIAFGQGLVPTPDDFGYRGEPPVHRRLLDRLAVEFVDSGWDVKATLRRIVLSRAYALSNAADAEAHQADPDNRLFARFPSRRLEAEMTVDRLRFAAETLHERIGGPSVFSYEPGDRWKDLSYSPGDLTAQLYRRGKGEDLYRRALYTFWKRASPPVTLSLFDVSPRETCLLARGETRTPLQALATLNDPVALDAYRTLGHRLADDVRRDDRERLIELFRLATSRAPSSTEAAALESELAGLRAALASNPADVEATLAGGFSPMPAEERTVERAAWSLMATLTMNLPESLEY